MCRSNFCHGLLVTYKYLHPQKNAPEAKPKSRRRQEETADDEQHEPEPVVEPELVSVESEAVESPSVEPEPEEVVPESEVADEEPEEPEEETSEDQVDAAEPEKKAEPEKNAEPESYEARMAERRRRRADRSNEMQTVEVTKSEEPSVGNGVGEDSYEARREARRKAREERLKTTSSNGDDKPRLSYQERKALDNKKQMDNARDSRNKWSNMEEDSGDK